jgi:hypothetical protein
MDGMIFFWCSSFGTNRIIHLSECLDIGDPGAATGHLFWIETMELHQGHQDVYEKWS